MCSIIFIDIVSKNGNLLLNTGPRSDGTIPEDVQKVPREVGAWLDINGESIYATRPWRLYGEGPTKPATGSFHDTGITRYTAEDFRFTTRADSLYAIGLAWPANGESVIHSLASVPGNQPSRSWAVTELYNSNSERMVYPCTSLLRVRRNTLTPCS